MKKNDRVRRAHAQRHNTGPSSTQTGQDRHSSAQTATYIHYNKGVCSQKHIRQKAYFISMCVLCVGQMIEKPIAILRLNVVGVQTMNGPGHDPGFEVCP